MNEGKKSGNEVERIEKGSEGNGACDTLDGKSEKEDLSENVPKTAKLWVDAISGN